MWINLSKEEAERICKVLATEWHWKPEEEINTDTALAGRLLSDMANRLDPENEKWISAANESYLSAGSTDGDIDIDSDAVVSDSGDGAYVMMWGWVRNSEVGLPDAEDEEEDEALVCCPRCKAMIPESGCHCGDF